MSVDPVALSSKVEDDKYAKESPQIQRKKEKFLGKISKWEITDVKLMDVKNRIESDIGKWADRVPVQKTSMALYDRNQSSASPSKKTMDVLERLKNELGLA